MLFLSHICFIILCIILFVTYYYYQNWDSIDRYFVFKLFQYRDAPTSKFSKTLQKICSFAIQYAWFLPFTWESWQKCFRIFSTYLFYLKWSLMHFESRWIFKSSFWRQFALQDSLAKTENSVFSKKKGEKNRIALKSDSRWDKLRAIADAFRSPVLIKCPNPPASVNQD